jgi:transcription antitermination factor NusG
MRSSKTLRNDPAWFLIHTKPSKERWVRDQLSEIVPEVFLPLLRARAQRWGRLTWSVMPLFSRYVFARFELEAGYQNVSYLPGVQGLVSAGKVPLVVPETIVAEIKRRGVNGIVQIQDKPFGGGEKVRVVGGAFHGFEAVFERYLSNAERVAILLNSIETGGLRVVLPVSSVTRRT